MHRAAGKGRRKKKESRSRSRYRIARCAPRSTARSSGGVAAPCRTDASPGARAAEQLRLFVLPAQPPERSAQPCGVRSRRRSLSRAARHPSGTRCGTPRTPPPSDPSRSEGRAPRDGGRQRGESRTEGRLPSRSRPIAACRTPDPPTRREPLTGGKRSRSLGSTPRQPPARGGPSAPPRRTARPRARRGGTRPCGASRPRGAPGPGARRGSPGRGAAGRGPRPRRALTGAGGARAAGPEGGEQQQQRSAAGGRHHPPAARAGVGPRGCGRWRRVRRGGAEAAAPWRGGARCGAGAAGPPPHLSAVCLCAAAALRAVVSACAGGRITSRPATRNAVLAPGESGEGRRCCCGAPGAELREEALQRGARKCRAGRHGAAAVGRHLRVRLSALCPSRTPSAGCPEPCPSGL